MTEQYQCKSYSDDNHVVQDCTCGKCRGSWEAELDIAIANLLFAGLSIAQMEKIPKWMLENVEKNKSKFKQALLTQSKAQEDTIKSLRAVIRSMDRELKDYDAIALYDIYAMAFYYDTGIWPAGKSAPMEMHHEFDHAERSKKYTEWLQALTHPTIKGVESWEDRFDKKFGKAGPEANTDSVGRRAGCDDCSENIELREEHKAFVASERTQLLQEIEEEVKVLKNAELIAAAGTRGFEKETRIYLEAITDVLTIIRNKLKV